MKRTDAIKTILDSLKDDDIAFFTTGMISREAFYIKDRKANFYIIGSMGLVSSVGLGVALSTRKKVVIFDGEGSLLMDMGIMAVIASLRPKNLVHFVLDNESYQSTGGQPTVSSDIDLEKVAIAVGYLNNYKLKRQDVEQGRIKHILRKPGPTFVLIKVDKKSDDTIGRVLLDPEQMRDRIKDVLK